MREYNFLPSEELSAQYIRRVEVDQSLNDSDLRTEHVGKYISGKVLDTIVCQAIIEEELISTRWGFTSHFLGDLEEVLDGTDRCFASQLYKEFRNYMRGGSVKVGGGKLELNRLGNIILSGYKVEIPNPDLGDSGWVVTE